MKASEQPPSRNWRSPQRLGGCSRLPSLPCPRVSPAPPSDSALQSRRTEGTIMAVLYADPTGTPAVEALDGDYGGTEPGKHHPLEPRKHHTLAYTVLGLGIAAAAFFVAWGLHGNTSSTYRIGNQWGAFTGLFILALAIES